MIKGTHPIVALLESSEWVCHLVGSRFVGKFDRDTSDYDFLLEIENNYTETEKLWPWLEKGGFVRQGPAYYGDDRYIVGTNVWKWTDPKAKLPSVDVLPVTPEEAARRMEFFAAMKKAGDEDGGLLAKALKDGKCWPTLWVCLARMRDEQ